MARKEDRKTDSQPKGPQNKLEVIAEVHANPEDNNIHNSVQKLKQEAPGLIAHVEKTSKQKQVTDEAICESQSQLSCDENSLNRSLDRKLGKDRIAGCKGILNVCMKVTPFSPSKTIADVPPPALASCNDSVLDSGAGFVEVITTKYHCTQCRFVTGNKPAIMSHVSLHDSLHTASCKACNFVFESQTSMKLWHEMNNIRHKNLTKSSTGEERNTCVVSSRGVIQAETSQNRDTNLISGSSTETKKHDSGSFLHESSCIESKKRKQGTPRSNASSTEKKIKCDGASYPCKVCGKMYKKPYFYIHQKHAHTKKQWMQESDTNQGK